MKLTTLKADRDHETWFDKIDKLLCNKWRHTGGIISCSITNYLMRYESERYIINLDIRQAWILTLKLGQCPSKN